MGKHKSEKNFKKVLLTLKIVEISNPDKELMGSIEMTQELRDSIIKHIQKCDELAMPATLTNNGSMLGHYHSDLPATNENAQIVLRTTEANVPFIKEKLNTALISALTN